ncbi:hypothetical protein H9Y04_25330 [Streptomyces sp. TRM66268-LWL]|uniref:Transcriptional regulator n=1 Tax=Streptomyces polyasparticus TaxID=2767826 RepID=A0ABR7SKB1_9ACTN|nr:hypothetical protein [Streptomyces polyasparticus]MBC9715867.1 hypothetical protein [Streptomyces polyasparticus]
MTRQPNRALAALLAESGWTYGELALAVNDLGAHHGLRLRYDRSSVAHWLKGSRPKEPVVQVMAQVFAQRCGRLVTPADLDMATDDSPAPAPGLHAGPREVLESLVKLCRHQNTGKAPPLTGPSAVERVRDPGWHPRTRTTSPGLSEEPVARLHLVSEMSDTLLCRYGSHGRTALERYVADEAASAQVMRRPRQAAAHLIVCARLAYTLAAMTADEGRAGLALRYHRAALLLARLGQDRGLYAITLRAMSAQALAQGATARAEELITQALRNSEQAAPAVRAFVLGQQALVLAHSRRQATALDTLRAAERAYRLHGDTGADAFTHYPVAGLHYQRGELLFALRDNHGAADAYREALAAQPRTQHLARALTHRRLGSVFHRQHRWDEATVHWNEFLARYPQVRSARADRDLARVVREARTAGGARGVLDRARALQRVNSTGRAL